MRSSQGRPGDSTSVGLDLKVELFQNFLNLSAATPTGDDRRQISGRHLESKGPPVKPVTSVHRGSRLESRRMAPPLLYETRQQEEAMDKCLMCGSRAFVLLTSVECSNPSCVHYKTATRECQVTAAVVDRRSQSDQRGGGPESQRITNATRPRPWRVSTLQHGVEATWTLALGEAVFATRTPRR